MGSGKLKWQWWRSSGRWSVGMSVSTLEPLTAVSFFTDEIIFVIQLNCSSERRNTFGNE